MPRRQLPWYRTRAAGLAFAAVLVLVAGAGAVGSFVFGVLAGVNAASRTRYLIFGGLCVVAPVLVSTFYEARTARARRRIEDVQVQAEARLLVTLGSALAPSLYSLGRIVETRNQKQKRELAGQLVQSIVAAAAELCGPDDARSVFFRLQGKKMECEAFAGRAEPSRTVFSNEPSDTLGRAAFAMVHQADSVLYEDVGETAPPGFAGPTSYRTFIAAAVTAGETPYGLLTVDAPEPGSLNEQDREVAKVLATLLGAGLGASPLG